MFHVTVWASLCWAVFCCDSCSMMLVSVSVQSQRAQETHSTISESSDHYQDDSSVLIRNANRVKWNTLLTWRKASMRRQITDWLLTMPETPGASGSFYVNITNIKALILMCFITVHKISTHFRIFWDLETPGCFILVMPVFGRNEILPVG